MSTPQLQEQIAAATIYEEIFVPTLFSQWASFIVRAAEIQAGHRVLDVACGTGALARDLTSYVGDTGHIVGLDQAPGMVAVAKRVAPTIEWHEGSADNLPFPDHSFDAVVSQFVLMFFPDRPKALHEMLRVLVPGGRLAATVWDSLENIPAFATIVDLVERAVGSKGNDGLRAPYGLGDRSDLLQLAQEADIANVEIQTHQATAHLSDVRALVEAELRGYLPVVNVFMEETEIQEILAEAEDAFYPFANGNGQVEFSLAAHILSGTNG